MGGLPHLQIGVMNICIVTPAPRHSRKGNRITAERWARLIRELGHRVTIVQEYSGQSCDLMVALHARRSFSSIARYCRDNPHKPLIVALTGTDLYRDIRDSRRAQQSLELASRLIVLQPLGIGELPAHLRSKATVIYQSVEKPRSTIRPRKQVFDVGVIGHLRPEKDPFRASMAARRLPNSSRIRIIHAGAALSLTMERRAREEERRNQRYRWLGELTHAQTRRLLARCRILVLSSRMEGGANLLSEAIAAGVPVLASRISGTIGLLGESYPGYFEVGNTGALTALLERVERDAEFLRRLQSWLKPLRPLIRPASERESWRRLISELKSTTGRKSKRGNTGSVSGHYQLVDCNSTPREDDLAEDVRAGLTSDPKHLSCRFLYDRKGSELFEAICKLPEYYLTRAESEIIETHAREIAETVPAKTTLIELGSGSSAKTRLLIGELHRRNPQLVYVPIDIARDMLEQSSRALLRQCRGIRVLALAGEYNACLSCLEKYLPPGGAKLILWLGSNIGNLGRHDAANFLVRIARTLGAADRVLVGIDLRKDRAALERAYDDSAGVTAQFSSNLLARINREIGGHFQLSAFRHEAQYEEADGRMKIFLRSLRDQRVRIDDLKLDVRFAKGERIHIEDSYKYSFEEITELADAAGLRLERLWLDTNRQFSLNAFARSE